MQGGFEGYNFIFVLYFFLRKINEAGVKWVELGGDKLLMVSKRVFSITLKCTFDLYSITNHGEYEELVSVTTCIFLRISVIQKLFPFIELYKYIEIMFHSECSGSKNKRKKNYTKKRYTLDLYQRSNKKVVSLFVFCLQLIY